MTHHPKCDYFVLVVFKYLVAYSHPDCSVAPKAAMSVFSEVWTINFEQTKMLYEEAVIKKEYGAVRINDSTSFGRQFSSAQGSESQTDTKPLSVHTSLPKIASNDGNELEFAEYQNPGASVEKAVRYVRIHAFHSSDV